MSVDRKPGGTVQDDAEEGPPVFRAAHAPATGAADEFGEWRAGLEQHDHFRERIDQDRTPRNV